MSLRWKQTTTTMRSQAEPCEMNISDKDVDEKVNAVNRFPLHNCLGRFLLLKRPHSRIEFFYFYGTVQALLLSSFFQIST